MSTKGGAIKLKRTPNRDVIQKNLEPLKHNLKKKHAQAHYYNNQAEGVSPMIRDMKKPPVHLRLGDKNRQQNKQKKVNMYGTNTSAIMPKKKFFRNANNDVIQRRIRVFTAQSRINKIRARQQNNFDRGNQSITHTLRRPPQGAGQKKMFKLRRSLPNRHNNQNVNPNNFTVHVQNNASDIVGNQSQRFKQKLNTQVQQEIRNLQAVIKVHQVVAPFPVKPEFTSVCMHDRFAML